MNNFLISIGCDAYQNVALLYGAEKDASDIYDFLIDDEMYSSEMSTLLSSPTKADIELALVDMPTGLNILTLYFAGHGIVDNNVFYLCPVNTRIDALSLTGITVSSIFQRVKELRVRHLNIVIDACNSGGAQLALNSFINQDFLNGSLTSIAVLAACRSTQSALETPDGGVLTQSLIAKVRDENGVDSAKEYFNLIDIGDAISGDIKVSNMDQDPISWGLNLYGNQKFCQNRNFIPTNKQRYINELSVSESSRLKISQLTTEILDTEVEFQYKYCHKKLIELLSKCSTLFNKANDGDDYVIFLEGIYLLFRPYVEKTNDLFDELLFVDSLISSASLFTLTAPPSIERLISKRQKLLSDCINTLYDNMQGDCFYLLDKSAAMSDLFNLPIRVSRILGYIGSFIFVTKQTNNDPDINLEKINLLITLLYQQYPEAFLSISDCQAPYLYLFFHVSQNEKWHDLAVVILNQYYYDLASTNTAVCKSSIVPEMKYEYCKARHKGQASELGIIAKPSNLLSAIFITGAEYEIDKEWNLEVFDRNCVSYFYPETYNDFGLKCIEEGSNYTIYLGDNAWHVHEIIKSLRQSLLRDSRSYSLTNVQFCLAVVSSLVRPDRVPYILSNDLIMENNLLVELNS